MKINDLFEGKSSKEQAGYIPRPKNGEKCINCTMWRDPNKCTAVAGDISPNGWCEWYAGGAYGKRGKRVTEAKDLGLTIFDIDDTLFRTTAQIKVVKDGQIVKSLNNQEFNTYKLQPGESFDFGEFKNAEKFNRESIPIQPMIAKLKAIINNAGDSKVIMLTARSDFDNKELFLDTFRKYGIDMSRVHVHRAGNLGGSPSQNKAVWIRRYLDTGDYGRVRLYDDAMSNIKMFINLQQEYPNIKFFPYFVTHEGSIKTIREDGRIVKGVNTTVDVGPDEIKTQAAKFGNIVDRDGVPPSMSKVVKGKSTNVLFNLGLTESQEPRYTAREWAIIEGGHSLEDVKPQPKKPGRIFSALDEYELEDRHPNDRPIGPEFKPSMPSGSIRVKVSDVYDWYKLGQHISDLGNLDHNDFGKGPPEAVIAFGSEEEEHKYIKLLQKLGLEILDIDPGAADAPGVKTDPTYNTENFADGKKPGRKGLSKRMGKTIKGYFPVEKTKEIDNVAEGGAETSWSDDTDTITLQDILELTKNIKQINLPINDNLKNKLIHWDGNPEEMERVNQVIVSNQFPILIMVDEQGQIEWILDGNHRLHKAIQSQAKTIPAKLIKPSDLSDKAKKIFQVKEQSVAENFADGKNPGRKGLSKRMGVNTKASVSSLRKTAKNSSGEKQRMAHWLANMKAGRQKAKKK